MGFMRNIAIGLLDAASKGRNSTLLMLIFQDNQRHAKVAIDIFERCLAERGLILSEALLNEALREVSKYPRLTIGEFLDGIV